MMSTLKKIFYSISHLLFNSRESFALLNKKRQDKYWENSINERYNVRQLPEFPIANLIGKQDILISPISFLHGSSLPTDILLLIGLAKRIDDCRYFEIGTWRGESFLNVIRECQKATSLSLSKNEAKNIGMSEDFISQIDLYLKDSKDPRMNLIRSNSMTFDFGSLDTKYDLIFIDGDHTYEGILSDTKNAIKIWSEKPNSTIVWHDYCYYPNAVRFPTLAAILEGIPKEYHSDLYYVTNSMCAILTRNSELKTELLEQSTGDISFELNMSIVDSSI